MHLEVDISGSSVKYQTGDHVGVWATNSTSEVERLVKALGLHSIDAIITLESNNGK